MLRRKKLILLFSATSLLLVACASPEEKQRKEFLEKSTELVLEGDNIEALKNLEYAKKLAAFDEKEQTYSDRYYSLLESEFNNALKKGKESYAAGEYAEAIKYFEIDMDIINSISYDFGVELTTEIKNNYSQAVLTLTEEKEFNVFYSAISPQIDAYKTLNQEYLSHIDNYRSGVIDEATFNKNIIDLQRRITTVISEVQNINILQISETNGSTYLGYYNELLNLFNSTKNAMYTQISNDNSSVLFNNANNNRASIIQSEQNIINFKTTNKYKIYASSDETMKSK